MRLGLATLLLVCLHLGPAWSQRRACTATYDPATGRIDVEAAQAASRYRVRLAGVIGVALRFQLESATSAGVGQDCFDPAVVGSTQIAIPDLVIAGNHHSATLTLAPGGGTRLDLAGAGASSTRLDLTYTRSARLVPDAGFRVLQASNPWASVVGGTTYLGYQDRNNLPEGYQSSTDGLNFSGRVTLTNANRGVDSRRTLMPDGRTWRLYQMTQAGVMTSHVSSDGNVFTPETGIRYTAPTSDNGRTGVYDVYVAPDGAVVLVYVGDLAGRNNLRMAKSTDNGVTFAYLKGNVLGDDDAGGGGNSFIDNKTVVLLDGRRRMFTMRSNELQSFVTSDGYNWTREPGTRISPGDYASAGVTIHSLNDPVAVIDASGRTKVYVAASTAAMANEGPGNTNWAIVSATWSEEPNYTSLWWNSAEPGWGLNLNHQGDILFGTLFTYDSTGAPLWLVMSSGRKQPNAAIYSGDLYRTDGPAFNAAPFTPIGPGNVTPVGTMTVSFAHTNGATLTYSVNGVTVTKSIQRQVFGTGAAECVGAIGTRAAATNYQDLWWNPSESGWGLNLAHQGDTLFGTLFTYDGARRPLWLVMSAGVRQGDGSYLGDLYQTTGPAFNAAAPPGAANATRVGTMRLTFASGNDGTLAYAYNGTTVAKAISRQVFSSPAPLCSS